MPCVCYADVSFDGFVFARRSWFLFFTGPFFLVAWQLVRIAQFAR
jgi:hypothetical protein